MKSSRLGGEWTKANKDKEISIDLTVDTLSFCLVKERMDVRNKDKRECVCVISQENWVYINCLPVYPAKKHFLNIYYLPSALKKKFGCPEWETYTNKQINKIKLQ